MCLERIKIRHILIYYLHNGFCILHVPLKIITVLCDLDLFNKSDLSYKRIKLTNEIDVTKRDKVLMKNIYKFNRRNVTADQDTQTASVKLLAHMSSNPHLYEFLQKKKASWDSQTPEE